MYKNIRTGLFGILSIGIYIGTIYGLFFLHNILASFIGIIAFFAIFHFFYIGIYAKYEKTLLFTILIITLLEVLIFDGVASDTMIGGLIVVNTSIVYLGYILKKTANETIIFKATDYFRNGAYIFTMGITIAYSLFIIGLYNSFPFSCNDLNQGSEKIITNIAKSLNISWLKNQNTTKILNETKVKDLLMVGKILNIESDIKGVGPIETFKERKNELITKTINDNQEINQGICEYTLNKLNEKLKYPKFQISIILLMVVILYPLLRIGIQGGSLVGVIIFTCMQKLKIYETKKTLTEVDKIE